MIVGITGTDGGGKGTVVEYLVKEKDFIHCSARDLWIDEINKRGLEVSRANMRIVANNMREIHGDNFLITEYKRRTNFDPSKNYVIESIRAMAEVETLKEENGVLWGVDADQHLRFERIQKRASESDKISFEEFAKQETLEMNDPNPHGMQKAKVIAAVDTLFTNNGTQEELFAQVEEALQPLEAKPREA